MNLRLISKAIIAAFLFSVILIASLAFADSAPSVDPGDFASQVLKAIHDFGGLPWGGKVASVVLLVVSSMKVSFLNDLVWSKLGAAQVWIAPILGLVGGILSPLMSGGSVSLAGVMAYVAAGAGAILLHELLDSVKAIPGLGSLWVSLISLIEGKLGGPASAAPPVVIVK